MSKPAYRLRFVDFKNICSECTVNRCKRLYAVLLPEEEEDFKEVSFEVKTDKVVVKCIGSNGEKPCPFLNDQGYCTIYEKRPFDCRLWPVVIYIDFRTRDKVVYLDLDCPAVRNGRISIDRINKVVDSVKDLEFNEKWLEKYTLASWANNFIEIHRFKQVKSS